MINCPNCGKEFADGTLFCDNCGTKLPEPAPVAEPAPAAQTVFCSNCGKPSSSEFAFCQNCGASLAAGTDPAAANDPPKEKKPFPKKVLLFGAIGLAVVAAAVILIVLLSGSKGAASYALYLKDGEIVYNDFGKDGGREISERLYDDEVHPYVATEVSPAIAVSKDGKTIIYPDRIDYDSYGANLYIRSLVKDEEPEKIDSDICDFVVNDDFTFVTYCKGEDSILYRYDVKKAEKEKFSSEVSDFYVTDDAQTVVFQTFDGGLYTMTAGGDKEKLDSEISWIYSARNDCKDIYYLKEGNLYYITPGEDRTKIASDVDSVLRVYDSGEVYYTTYEFISTPYSEFVVDDMAAADAAFAEPEWPDYPSWYEYDTDEEYDAAYEAYQQAVDEYYDAWDLWYEVQDRNYIREDLYEYTYDRDVYTLHYYDGTDSTVVAENYTSWDSEYYYSVYDYALDVPVMIYKTQREGEFSTINLSELDSIWDVDTFIYESMSSDTDMYIASGAVSSPIDQSRALHPMLSNDGKTLFFIDDYNNEKECGELYIGAVSAGKDSVSCELSLYDSDVSLAYLRTLRDGNSILYLKDYDGEKGELFVDGESIDYDVYGYVDYNEESNTLAYFTDYSYEKEYGTLKVSDFKETVKVEDDVHNYELLDNGYILFLYDYSLDHQNGELYLYDGGKENTRLDDDVTAIIPICNYKYRGVA